jgi:hypothetical protein
MDTASATIKITSDDKKVDVLESVIVHTTEKFIFNAATDTNTISIIKTLSYGLADALQEPKATLYELTADDIITQDLGSLNSDNLEVRGAEGYSINGNGHSGLTVGANKTLLINSVDEITGFETVGNGGFISIEESGELTVKNTVFTNNKAKMNSLTGEGGYSGVIDNYNGNLIIENSTFENNTAESGGAIGNWGKTDIIDSVFTNNTATDDGVIHNAGTVNIFANNNAAAQQAIMHLHIHIVPRKKGDFADIYHPRSKTEFDLKEIQKQLLLN